MIANILKYNLLVSLYLMGFQLEASSHKYQEERKVIERTFDVKADTWLKIDNTFGDIHVESWDSDQIYVEVEIIVKGRNEERANRIIDKIEIDISEEPDEISFDTEMNDIQTRGNSESFEVNYLVKMNPENPIQFENKFGNIYLPDRMGKTEIEISYGNLKAEDMKDDFHLDVAFGGADVGELINAEMEIKYSDINIAKARRLEIEQKFSNLEMGAVEVLDMEAKYGEVKIKQIGRGTVEAHYSAFEVEVLYDRLVFEGNYVSGFNIGLLKKGFSLLDLSGQYTSYEVTIESGLEADIQAEFSYSKLQYPDIDIDFYYKDFDGNTKEYRGRLNGGNDNAKIVINSSYGSLHLHEGN